MDRPTVMKALIRAKGNASAAARELGVNERVIRYWRDKPEGPPAAAPEEIDAVAKRSQALAAQAERASVRSLTDEVRTLREQIASMRELTAAPFEPIRRVELTSGLRESCAFAAFSDIHSEERVRPCETPTGNAYNLDIAALRIGRFFAGVEWQIETHRQWTRINTLVLWLGGDLMSGLIHEELRETTQLSPIKTMLWLRPQIEAGIRRLAEIVPDIRIVCSFGNHGRDTQKIRHATGAAHSYEWGMYQVLADKLSDLGNVTVTADESQHQYAQVFDFHAHMHHGDAISYNGGVGGIMIPINKATDSWNRARACHIHVYGHWHQYIPGLVTVNGSGIGFNAYAMRIKARPEPAQQAFFLIDSKRCMTAMSPIWLSDPSAEAALWKEAA